MARSSASDRPTAPTSVAAALMAEAATPPASKIVTLAPSAVAPSSLASALAAASSPSANASATAEEAIEPDPLAAQESSPTTAAPLQTDHPCDSLRALASRKGLELEVYSGRTMPDDLAAEAVALAQANMQSLSGWNARQRASDLGHTQTKILVLRRPLAPSVSASTARCESLPPRASRSRRRAHVAAASTELGVELEVGLGALGTRGGAPSTPSSVAGFASFRFVTQETLRVVYLYELHLEEELRRQGLGTALLKAVHHYGTEARRQGLLLTVHLQNVNARRFYEANRLVVAPISPSQCAPPSVAALADYDVMQSLWSTEADEIMQRRGAAARALNTPKRKGPGGRS